LTILRNLLSFFDQNAYRREVARYSPALKRVNALENNYQKLDEAGLRAITDQLRARTQDDDHLDDFLPEAFAVVREAARRTIGLRPFDVQIIGAIVLHRGAIAEMKTGEGKTLVATLPLYLNALAGKGAHLVTVNDYLARRDARWMGPVFHILGMNVGVLQADDPEATSRNGLLFDPSQPSSEERLHLLRPVSRAEAYAADVTYGTNSEFGFDYLRDNLVHSLEEKVQRGLHYAIIDEVDNILIDEARTPLIISGENRSEIEWYVQMAAVVRKLGQRDVEIDRRDRVVSLTPIGEKHVSTLLGWRLFDTQNPEESSLEQRHLIGHLEQALRARFLYERDREYILQEGEVVIVDENTGRMMPGRRWTDGLHQAVEAKENLEVQSESMTYATITLQNYFRMYAKLSGMTGTALTAAPEFEKTYRLQVHPIPTNVEYKALGKEATLLERQGREADGQDFTYYIPLDEPESSPLYWKRVDYPDQLYLNVESKRRAIAWEILRYHVCGRPLLVGTTSVADSEDLSRYLEEPMLVRLAQTRLLRQAWLLAHPDAHPELALEKLKFLYHPLGLISSSKVANAFASLKMDPHPLNNLPALLELLDLESEHSQRLETTLSEGIPNSILNARYHYEESQIIASAGSYGSVVIATNMAGRGVDIKLGSELAEEVLAAVNQILEDNMTPNPYGMSLVERRDALRKLVPERAGEQQAEVDFFLNYVEGMQRVKDLGGLHVIGSTRHEARRIDNQLRGRAARQGDPGSSRFFISMEDDIMARFGGLDAETFIEREEMRAGDRLLACPPDPSRRVIEAAQHRVEDENFEIRKHLLEYDDVITAQRQAIYVQRDRILGKADLSADLAEMLKTELDDQANRHLLAPESQTWRFIDWVERIQPSLLRSNGSLVPSWSLRIILQEALPDIVQKSEPEVVLASLLDTAESALAAEQQFIQVEVGRQYEAALDDMQAEIDDRMQIMEAALDAMHPEEAIRHPRQALKSLSKAAGMPVQLSKKGWLSLEDNRHEAEMDILDQVETVLLHSAAQRLAVLLEQFLGQQPTPDPGQASPSDEDELFNNLQAAVESEYTLRRERMLGPKGEIAHDLGKALRDLDVPLGEERAFALLEMMRTAQSDPKIDDEQVGELACVEENSMSMKVRMRSNPIFLAEELLAYTPPDEIASQALDHLMSAQRAMQSDLGAETLNQAYRQLLLYSIDERWVDYLTRLEELRYEVRLEGMAHNDPLVMYKSKAYGAYAGLLDELRRVVVAQMFTFLPQVRRVGAAEASALEQATPRLTYLKLG